MMRRNKLLLIVFAVFVCALAGCDIGARSPARPPTKVKPVTANSEANNQSTRVSPAPSSNTPLPNISQTNPTSTIPLVNRPLACINLQEPIPIDSESGLSGVVGLVVASNNPPPDDPSVSSSSQTILLGGQPLQERILFPSRQGIREIGFSPDGNWFAYQTKPGNLQGEPPSLFIHLIGAQGKTLATPLPLQEDETRGHWFGKWINNEFMLLTYDLPTRMESESRRALTVFDPFTGERYDELLSELPYWNRETAVYFSRDMTRVVYAGRDSRNSVLVLWDVEERKVLWQESPFISDVRFDEVGIGTTSGFGNLAIWSPDSTGFVFSAIERMGENNTQHRSYFVGREGEQERVLLSTSNRESKSIIYGGAWSPDQRYLVYFRSESIMLYDFSLGDVIELCSGLPSYVSMALWSPNSGSLAFMLAIEGQQHLLTLSIYTGQVVSIREIRNFFPAGWIANEDWLSIPR